MQTFCFLFFKTSAVWSPKYWNQCYTSTSGNALGEVIYIWGNMRGEAQNGFTNSSENNVQMKNPVANLSIESKYKYLTQVRILPSLMALVMLLPIGWQGVCRGWLHKVTDVNTMFAPRYGVSGLVAPDSKKHLKPIKTKLIGTRFFSVFFCPTPGILIWILIIST